MSSEIQVGLALVMQANTADGHGRTALIHPMNLPPIELRGYISLSECGLLAFVPGFAEGEGTVSTWVVPVSSIQSVEIRGEWISDQQERAEQIAFSSAF